MRFPLSFLPKLSYKTGGRVFGAPRGNADSVALRGSRIVSAPTEAVGMGGAEVAALAE